MKTSFNKQVSKPLNDELNKYHKHVKQKGKPLSPVWKSTVSLSEAFDAVPYQDQEIKITLDHTGIYLHIIDYKNQYSHIYKKLNSQELNDKNLITIEAIEKNMMRDIENSKLTNKPKEPKWNHTELGINVDATRGAFLDFGEPRDHDFIPVLATSQEVMLSADAVLGIGGSYELGAQALLFINTKFAKKGKRIREELYRNG